MSVPHLTPVVEAATAAAAARTLRRRGLRLSAARRVVLTALFAADRPLSAEEIAAGAGGAVPPSDLASVYRNLETLEALGLVRHMHLGHGPAGGRQAQPPPAERARGGSGGRRLHDGREVRNGHLVSPSVSP